MINSIRVGIIIREHCNVRSESVDLTDKLNLLMNWNTSSSPWPINNTLYWYSISVKKATKKCNKMLLEDIDTAYIG